MAASKTAKGKASKQKSAVEGKTYALPAVLGITSVEAVQSLLEEALHENGTVTVDASQVDRITSPGVQQLISLGHSLQQSDRTLHLTHMPNAMKEAFADLGLNDILEGWKV